ncbi:hypothetical protein Lal_00040372 [Lupinus albus]|nr:hypothetical protein Lal_00040372 [Lupinus albus]
MGRVELEILVLTSMQTLEFLLKNILARMKCLTSSVRKFIEIDLSFQTIGSDI